jgi:hypothetical protein
VAIVRRSIEWDEVEAVISLEKRHDKRGFARPG